MNKKEIERNQAITDLRLFLQEGETLYTILRHVSQSGMMRHISVIVIRDNEPHLLDLAVMKALGWKQAKDGSIKVSGCGMDMGFHLVSTLSRVLYPENERPDYVIKQAWI